MNTQTILNTIEVQYENYDLELNDMMLASYNASTDLNIPLTVKEKSKKEYITKARKERRIERAKNKYNTDYLLSNAKEIDLIRNRFNN